jgi:hypothetical protein
LENTYILENTPPPLSRILADVIWGKKYEKGRKCKRKRLKGKEKGRKEKEK